MGEGADVEQLYESSDEPIPQVVYYLAGSVNNWNFTPMEMDEQAGIYRMIVSVSEEQMEEFQIVVNQDWKQTLHPMDPMSESGESYAGGPDAWGDGLNWRIYGLPGESFMILLYLSQMDRRKTVTWVPVEWSEDMGWSEIEGAKPNAIEDGQPAQPTKALPEGRMGM